jgi:hypothetical protein
MQKAVTALDTHSGQTRRTPTAEDHPDMPKPLLVRETATPYMRGLRDLR